MNIILASASPRRHELLSIITSDFTVCAANVDESELPDEEPMALVQRLATLKARALEDTRSVIIGCDTVVELDGEVLGKPKSEASAVQMLSSLSGKSHMVHTGVCVITPHKCETFCESTRVSFANIPQHELLAYVKTNEPYDKAGGYGIQSWAAKFITHIDGCFFNVMGLPVAALYQKMVIFGVISSPLCQTL